MLTFPANSLPYQNHIGGENHIVVKLTDGTSTWYFSDTDMNLTDGHVYPLLITDDLSIHHGINIYTKNWEVSDINFKISNAPYKTSAGNWIKFADEISSLINQLVYVYFICGNRATSITDGLNVYIGKIIEHPHYDADYVYIYAVEKNKLLNKILPTVNYETAAVALGYNAGVYNDNNVRKKVPLLYGTYTFDIDSPYTGNGMAMGYALERGRCPKFIFSDHTIDAITDLWSSPIGAFPLEYYDHTLDNDDEGYATGSPVRDETTKAYLWLHLKVIGSDCYDYENISGDDLVAAAVNPEYLYDDNDTTAAVVKDTHDDGGGNLLCGGAGWSFHESDESALIAVMNYNDELGLDTPYQLKYYAYLGSSPAITGGTFTIWLLYDEPGLSSGEYFEFESGGIDDCFGEEIIKSGTIPVFTAVDRLCLKARHYYSSAPSPPADGTPNNITMFGIYYAKMKFGICNIPMAGVHVPVSVYTNLPRTYDDLPTRLINTPTPRFESAATSGPNESLGWAECQGREFGSWIDADGRLALFDEGEYIRDPVYIVESLLRDELGLTTADIDITSFDGAYNGSVEARLNQVKEEYVFDIIRRLMEQSDCCFIFDAVSKARMIDLGNSSPSTNRTIPASHILPAYEGGVPYISISKTPVYCNKMYLSSRWQGEYGIYRDMTTVENTTSQTAYGIFEGKYEWPNICGSSAAHIYGHLVSDADGIWSNPHVQIEFETFGFTNADVEVGDWIELDDTTIDPLIKCYGESWSGKQFMVTEVTQYSHATRIKAIELY